MKSNETTPFLVTAYWSGDDPIEWVLHHLTPRQAVLVRAFMRHEYGRDAVIASFVGRETYTDFVGHYDEEFKEFMAEGWRRPYSDDEGMSR